MVAAAARLRDVLDGGGTVHACGNGGSATDAMDFVADLRTARDGLPARRALDLTEDAAILSAISNDVGTDAVFARQIIAYARPGDALVAFSTSGESRNVVHALEEARRRGLASVAFVGYDGGRIAADALADHVVLSPSQHIPRVQEAQATAYHIVRALIEAAPRERASA
jgi:D-sedoheptulose 7-phosphate isomerase